MEASAPEPVVPQETEPDAVDEMVQGVEESLAASISEESPDEEEPLEDEKPAPDVAESVAEVAASETEIPEESEPEPAVDITKEAGEPLAASVMQESPEESPEPSIAENGVFPLVRDSRGAWRPGKGFSRSELREAGLESRRGRAPAYPRRQAPPQHAPGERRGPRKSEERRLRA